MSIIGKFQRDAEVVVLNWSETWTIVHGPLVSHPTLDGMSHDYYVIKDDRGSHEWVREPFLALAPIIYTEQQTKQLREVLAACVKDFNQMPLILFIEELEKQNES